MRKFELCYNCIYWEENSERQIRACKKCAYWIDDNDEIKADFYAQKTWKKLKNKKKRRKK